ncbi:hypothetical protein AX16_006624 [Volvariella volvacea WC 439]|nr:hypothetical protein AX16_006624 [Volvariella volvacea WC 439]
MLNVLLLRASSSQDSPTNPDRYESVFDGAGYHPISINPLETVLTNLDDLATVVVSGPGGELGYQGVVITSSRACEAWDSAIRRILEKSQSQVSGGGWHETPFYVVGEATASQLSAIQKVHGPSSPYVPKDIRGAGSGTGEQLAHFILEDLGDNRPARLLYLTGDKNRDTIPTILSGGGVELRPLQVYATQGSSSFGHDLEVALSKASHKEWWIVYFAPSSSQFVMPILEKHFTFAHHDQLTSLPQPRIASIGPTTSSFLRDALKLHVEVTARKPSPDDLLAAIAERDRAHTS